LFSTTTCCFHICVSLSAMMRVTTSGLLPAAAGVMKVTGLVGHSCACAGAQAKVTKAAMRIDRIRMSISP
jgi:hypothetical protein